MLRKNPYLRYYSEPIIIGAGELDRVLTFTKDGVVVFRPALEYNIGEKNITITKENVFDLLLPTMFGLMDDLTPGSYLIDIFLKEWSLFQEIMDNEHLRNSYGEWVYYPLNRHLVHYAPRFWHRLALIVRNSILLNDPSMTVSWYDVRKKFENSVISIAGCSVGNNIITSAVMLMRPLYIKIADSKDYQVNNANRVRLLYSDFGRNKAIVTAEQLHATDPFFKISVYSEGIHNGNVNDFVFGNPAVSEPASTLIIEETDDPDTKILLREKARSRNIPVVMVTDIGSAEQIDIRRFDLDNKISLAVGVSDGELYEKRDEWQRDLADREKFFEFAFSMSGREQLTVPEFKRIILQEVPMQFAGIPQLGSTAAAAGGIAADVISRIILGHETPERIFIDYARGRMLIK